MPNWCNNTLSLHHKDPAMIKRASEAFENDKFASEFCPIPEELQGTEASFLTDGDDALVEKYGYSNWYAFSVGEWGTKWDFGGDVQLLSENDLFVSFDTAWSPPIELMYKLEALGFEVQLSYFEPGMGFVGLYTTAEGDEFYDELAEAPDDMREYWNIDDMLADMEEEEDGDV